MTIFRGLQWWHAKTWWGVAVTAVVLCGLLWAIKGCSVDPVPVEAASSSDMDLVNNHRLQGGGVGSD